MVANLKNYVKCGIINICKNVEFSIFERGELIISANYMSRIIFKILVSLIIFNIIMIPNIGLAINIENPSIVYRVHAQTYGWMEIAKDGEQAGTTGEAKRLEAIQIKVKNDNNLNVLYKSHIQGIGWEKEWSQDGKLSGTTGKSKRLEAIQIKLSGTSATKYDIYYRAHIQSYGWLGWAKNGAKAGSTDIGYRMEAIQIKIVRKGEKINNGQKTPYITIDTHKPKNLNNFLFIGDSVTYGLSAYTNNLKASGLIFRAVSGSAPSNWVGRNPYKPHYIGKPSENTYKQLPANNNINGIVVMLGANEVEFSENEAIKSMEILIKELHKKYPNKIIYVQKILAVLGKNRPTYNKKLQDLCNSSELKKYTRFIDCTENVSLADGTHPTKSGYNKLADNIRKAICGN